MEAIKMPEETNKSQTDSSDADVNKNKQETERDPREEQISNLNAALRVERDSVKQLKREMESFKNSHLEEQNKFKELYEELKPKYEESIKQVDEVNSYFTATLEEAKTKAPKEVLELLPSNLTPKDQITWITKAADTFSSNASATSRNVSTKGMTNPPVTDRVNITPEQYMSMSRDERQKHLDDALTLREELRTSGNS